MAGLLLGGLLSGRYELSGTWRVTGVVDALGAPGAYRVQLYDLATHTLVAQTISGADGVYSFEGLAHRPYFAVAFDHGPTPLVAGISDQLTLEPMA